ncbi:MAG: GNAT family N-acetyltransferase [Candidatus Dormibacteraeota bacterium]|nr:GNAT family N-acetyltransferase [Candidatus Dormibacteraeota bacterium]
MSFRVRQLRSAEFERWRDLRLRALRDSPNAFGTRYEDELGRPLSSCRQRARDLAAAGARVMFVVDTGKEHLAGCAGAYREADGTPRVISMWVSPEIRMQGAGRDLLRNLADWARQRGLHNRRPEWSQRRRDRSRPGRDHLVRRLRHDQFRRLHLLHGHENRRHDALYVFGLQRDRRPGRCP